MGRRKKHREQIPIESKAEVVYDFLDEREDEFNALCEMAQFTIPYTLKNWSSYFLTRGNYLAAAEMWLEQKLSGTAWPRVEDDVDKGLMKRRSVNSTPTVWNHHQYYGHDDWEGWGDGCAWSGTTYPYTNPKISEPEGLTGALLHCM